MVLGRGCEIRVRHLVFKGSNGVIYGVRSLLVFIFYSYKKKNIWSGPMEIHSERVG